MKLLIALLVAGSAFASSPFRFERISPASLQLSENGKPVYVYNNGMMRPKGVPADRYRCCYLHPVYAPNGVVVTDDFPKDHYHHRGIFWVWPVVRVDGASYDLWLIKGIRKKFGSWIARETAADFARLVFTEGWYTDKDNREVVRERVEIVARPTDGDRRQLEFTIRLEALGAPVFLNGKATENKGYGGFCVRLGRRAETVITTDAGTEAKDTNMVPHPWAREDGAFDGGRAGIRIDIDPSNPGYPNGWCLRHYGFLGVNFPGLTGYTLQPGKPLTLRYKVTLFSDAGDPWQAARDNAEQAQHAIHFCKRLVRGWLDQADPTSGLLPRNLTKDRFFWNAQDCAADNFPFLLLTAFMTGDYHAKLSLLDMFAREQKLTNRLDRLPDDYLFNRQSFRPGPYKLSSLIFGASEYAKDGLTPITEWLGPGPWLVRMKGLVDDIWKHAPVATESGRLPSRSHEVNGEMMQTCSRLYWLTGDEAYRRWVFRLTDHYFLHENILEADRLQLDDHACEIIGGLSEGYLIAARTDPNRHRLYHAPMHAILDRVLESGRNEDGLLYHTINPKTGKVINDELTDNWGYNYNAFLTVDAIDGEPRYREAVKKALTNVHKYADYIWEPTGYTPRGESGADGLADTAEGGLNLLNRIPVASGFAWVDKMVGKIIRKQGADGIVEGWYGDGNSARTALMYALWKTQGITVMPWRWDVKLGALHQPDGTTAIYLAAARPWRGTLRFDRPRHRDYFHMPIDYPRINQFPEWTTVEEGQTYELSGLTSGIQRLDGKDLFAVKLVLEPNHPIHFTLRPIGGRVLKPNRQ